MIFYIINQSLFYCSVMSIIGLFNSLGKAFMQESVWS